MKKFIYFIFLISINSFSQNIECKYFYNDKQIKDFNIYLLKDKNLYKINLSKDSLLINSLTDKDEILIIYKKNKFLLPLWGLNEYLYIHIYQDIRLLNNTVNKKFRENMKLNYIFRKRYYIDYGTGNATIVRNLKNKKFKEFVFIEGSFVK